MSRSASPHVVAFQRYKRAGCSAVECWEIDLADFKTITAFAVRFESEGDGRLDILLENAGALNTQFIPTVDGWENTYVVASHV
jgi:retinol dehydrogenase-12